MAQRQTDTEASTVSWQRAQDTHRIVEGNMWIYRAYDKDGLPIAEDYHKGKLIKKLIDEFGDYKQFTIKRVHEAWLR